MNDRFDAKALDLHRAYFLGAYSPNDDAANVAALAAALRSAYEEGIEIGKKMADEEAIAFLAPSENKDKP